MKPETALEITRWTISEGLNGTPETDVLQGFCEQLVAQGVPILRANISQPTLHPIIGGHLFIWQRDSGGATQEDWQRNVDAHGKDFVRTPFNHMSTEKLSSFRRRLDGTDDSVELAMLERFREMGGTDYFALNTPFGEGHRLGPVDRILSSWLTDAPGGFSDDDIAVIEQMISPLALAVKGASTYRVANSVIATYLGADAARRVLGGEILRGTGETIRAALWFCDLQGFTKISETTPRDRLLAMLDDYFEDMVTAVHDHGGQVLKFMGDGLLAIFTLQDDAESCGAALDATDQALDQMAQLTTTRETEGLPVTGFRVALHLGDVMYGNIGARNRLDFTVVGPAVNEVSRIEAMCRSLDQDIVISSAFAKAAGKSSDRLVSLGRYALRGVRRPQELFTLFHPDELEDS
jgi:adenylate cyclase